METIAMNELDMLESKEFGSLLEAIEMMARAQGDLSHLTKTVSELRQMVDSGADILPSVDESIVCDIVETMLTLVEELTD